MRRDLSLIDFMRQFGDELGQWSASPALRAAMDRCIVAASTKRHPETLPFVGYDHDGVRVLMPQSCAVPGTREVIAVDLARGADRTVVTARRREGMTFVLDDHLFLPPTSALPWPSIVPKGTRFTSAPSECRARFITPTLMRLAGLSF